MDFHIQLNIILYCIHFWNCTGRLTCTNLFKILKGVKKNRAHKNKSEDHVTNYTVVNLLFLRGEKSEAVTMYCTLCTYVVFIKQLKLEFFRKKIMHG